VRSLSLATLRAEIGYVPQETLLFSETIGSNVAYGLEMLHTHTAEHPVPHGDELLPDVIEATRDAQHATSVRERPEVVGATEVAQLTETLAALPDGLDTPLGERGINLSGGQKQRTALARALARRPRLVMLDDALSAVDTHTEAAILRGLRSALAERTAVIASHRISAVRDADCILVLHEGAVVETGTHEVLMARGGRYAQLLRRQELLDAVEVA
jgi:ATP-binding cassette, subfamily B, multidrug efflux pump